RLDPPQRHRDDPDHCSSWRVSSRPDHAAGRTLMIRTVAQALDDAATTSGDFTFVRENGRALVTPFKVLRDSALALGGALRARGLPPGAHVAPLIPAAHRFFP